MRAMNCRSHHHSRRARHAIVAALACLGCASPLAGASSEPLLQISDLIYLGSFRVPNGQLGPQPYSEFSFDDDGLAYDASANGLYIKGHTYGQLVAEISIPTPLPVTDPSLANLNICALLQPFADPTYGHLDEQNIANGVIMGGILPYHGTLLGSLYGYYDSAGQQTLSHFIASPTLSDDAFQGLYAVGPMPVRRLGGYMTTVPSEWQAALGGPVITGHGGGTIITQSSAGPSLWTFDPANLGVVAPVPATPLAYYDANNNPTLGTWDSTGTSNPQFNACSGFTGVVFVPGTRTILVFGNTGLGVMGYGDPTDDPALNGTPAGDGATQYYDPTGGGKGQHCYPYSAYVWAYDANDLALAAAGAIPPWQVLPYASGPLALPINSGTNALNGAAYDPGTGRIYLSQQGGDTVAAYSDNPLIHVFTIAAGTPSPIPAITSAPSASGTVGAPFSYQVTATNAPTGYTVVAPAGSMGCLPPGLAISADGAISGSPTQAGTYPVALNATNAFGTGNLMLALTIAATPSGAPVIADAAAGGSAGAAFSFAISASNAPTSFGASGLPAGLSVDSATGGISGTPLVPGAYAIAIWASNAVGTGTAALALTITGAAAAGAPPQITGGAVVPGSVGLPFAYQIVAVGAPTSYGASGLPPGLAIDAATGLISGTPTIPWIGPVSLTATNGGGTSASSITIDIAGQDGSAPVISSAAAASGTVGVPFAYQIQASNSPTSFSVIGLPPGLSVNKSSGAITGTPTQAGVSDAAMYAVNSASSTVTTLAITISASGTGSAGSGAASATAGTSGAGAGSGSSGGHHCGLGELFGAIAGIAILLGGRRPRLRRRCSAKASRGA